MKCLTITLNAAVDATYVVERFAPGGVNRVVRKHEMPGGKGNNVARILAARGHAVVATGFLGAARGGFIERGLQEAGIESRFVWLGRGESRTCHTVLEWDTGRTTEILEAGPEIDDADRDRFLERLPRLMGAVDPVDVVVISGSAPIGAGPEFLERLGAVVRAGTPRMVVDSSGASLGCLLSGEPDLITPNEDEMRALMGHSDSLEGQISFARSRLIARSLAPGARVLISLGEGGAVLVSDAAVLRSTAPAVRVVSTVGCGDALLAGFVDGWLRGLDSAASMREAAGFGSAAALQEVAGVIAMSDVERLRPEVEVRDVAGSIEARPVQ